MGPAPSLLLKVLNLHFSCWQLRKKKKKGNMWELHPPKLLLLQRKAVPSGAAPSPPPCTPSTHRALLQSLPQGPAPHSPSLPAKAQGFCLFYFIDPPTQFTANTARSLFSERFASYVLGQLCSLATTFINQLCFGNISLHYQAKNLLTPVMCFLI